MVPSFGYVITNVKSRCFEGGDKLKYFVRVAIVQFVLKSFTCLTEGVVFRL